MSTNYPSIRFTQLERGNNGELFDKKDIQAYFTIVLDAYKRLFQYDLKYMKLIITDQPSVYSNGTPATNTHPVESCSGSHTKLNFITFNINYKSVMKFYKLPMEPARNMEEKFILTILAHELGHEFYQKHLSPRMKNTLIEEIRRTKFSTVYTQAVRENMMKGKTSKEKYEEELVAEYLAAGVIKAIRTENSGNENLSAQLGELVRIDWNYSDMQERAKHFDAAYKLFCSLDRNQLTIVPWFNNSPSKSDYVRYLTKAKSMGVKYFLYMLDTEYVGYGLYTPALFTKFRGLNLSNLYVDAKYRGRGYGTQMLKDFIAYGKENKYQRLLLQVLDGNPTAQKLYERFGFKPYSHALELGIEKAGSSSNKLYYLDIHPGVESMSHICSDILIQQKQIAQLSYVGYEDLNFIKRLFRNAANNVYRILQNVRSTVWNSFKDLKRSELQSYVDHNKFTVSHILDTKYAILANMDVHIPFKMSSTYYQAVAAVENTLLLLDMENRINIELNVAKAIVSQLMAKSTELSLGTNTISSYELEKLQTSFTKQDACFRSPSRVTKKRFDQVYRRPSSFKDTYTKLSKLTQYEYGVAKVYKRLENIYKQYDIMVNFLEKENPDIDKNSLARVHQHTYTIAKLFDMYGTTIMNVLRLEHNFVLTLEEIKKTHNL